MKNTVYCLAYSEPKANSILQQLRNLGFSASEVSVLLGSKDTKNISLREDAVRGAGTGGLLGGIIGWMAGLTALTIPGAGVFLAAGPLLHAIGGAAAGGAVGGLAGGSGAFKWMGVPDPESERFENELRNGAILVAVHSDDPSRRRQVVRTFRSLGCDDIAGEEEEAA